MLHGLACASRVLESKSNRFRGQLLPEAAPKNVTLENSAQFG